MWAVVVCREMVRDGFTGAEVPGGIVAVLPEGEVRRYEGLLEAARDLAPVDAPARIQVPEDEGWRNAVELPPRMAVQFMKYWVNERRALDGLAPL